MHEHEAAARIPLVPSGCHPRPSVLRRAYCESSRSRITYSDRFRDHHCHPYHQPSSTSFINTLQCGLFMTRARTSCISASWRYSKMTLSGTHLLFALSPTPHDQTWSELSCTSYIAASKRFSIWMQTAATYGIRA